MFFAWGHLSITPLATSGSFINAPDERAHLAYVEAIATGHRLPVRNDTQYPTYQWHQPPLYYTLAAAVYKLGLRAVRSVSVLFAIISLWAIWSAARLLLPRRHAAVTLAIGLPSLLPMRQALMASVGNDAATECMFSLTLFILVLIIHRRPTFARISALAIILTASLITKATCLLLLPLAFVGTLFASGHRSAGKRWMTAALPVLVALCLASPWYLRNAHLYGELVPMRAFHAEFAGTSLARDWIGKQNLAVDHWTGELRPSSQMTSSDYAALVIDWTARTFLAAYTPPSRQSIGAPVFMPPAAYAVFAVMVAVGIMAGSWRALRAAVKTSAAALSTLTMGLAVLLVAGSFAAFTTTYFQAQGRYLYPALLPLAILWGAGTDAMLPARYRWSGTTVLLGVLAALSAAFCFLYVAAAYAAPVP